MIEGTAADRLSWGSGADWLYGQEMGNDTMNGAPWRGVIYAGEGFDFVYACDG